MRVGRCHDSARSAGWHVTQKITQGREQRDACDMRGTFELGYRLRRATWRSGVVWYVCMIYLCKGVYDIYIYIYIYIYVCVCVCVYIVTSKPWNWFTGPLYDSIDSWCAHRVLPTWPRLLYRMRACCVREDVTYDPCAQYLYRDGMQSRQVTRYPTSYGCNTYIHPYSGHKYLRSAIDQHIITQSHLLTSIIDGQGLKG